MEPDLTEENTALRERIRELEDNATSWRAVPITAGMFCDAVARWQIDRIGLAGAIQLAAEAVSRK